MSIYIIFIKLIRDPTSAQKPLPAGKDPTGPFHLIYTPPYGREFLRGFEKAVSEGLCASASFDLCVFSEG